MTTDNAPPVGLDPAEGQAPSNGQAAAPAAAGEAPCDDCGDGITLGVPLTRSTERALGIFGIVMGGVIVLMGIDLWTGGRLARTIGLGGSDQDAEPGA